MKRNVRRKNKRKGLSNKIMENVRDKKLGLIRIPRVR